MRNESTICSIACKQIPMLCHWEHQQPFINSSMITRVLVTSLGRESQAHGSTHNGKIRCQKSPCTNLIMCQVSAPYPIVSCNLNRLEASMARRMQQHGCEQDTNIWTSSLRARSKQNLGLWSLVALSSSLARS